MKNWKPAIVNNMALFKTNKKTTEEAAKSVDKKPALKAAVKSEKKSEAAAVSMKELYAAAPIKKSKGAALKTKKSADHETSYRTLVKPLITEKATNLGSENKYVFVVAREANKIKVAKAIEATYGVKPVAVNILNIPGKVVTRGRIKGQRSDWRKAIVTLAKGETIKIYEGV